MIRSVRLGDEQRIAEIYNHYIAHTIITFETEPVSATEMAQRILSITEESQLPWLVAENPQGEVVGYAYASKWKGRCAYRYSVESTVYLDQACTGQGFGKKLASELLQQLQLNGYHTVISGIALPNAASVALHESLGMEQVAHFKEVGFKQERWVDVGYWQTHLEQNEAADSEPDENK